MENWLRLERSSKWIESSCKLIEAIEERLEKRAWKSKKIELKIIGRTLHYNAKPCLKIPVKVSFEFSSTKLCTNTVGSNVVKEDFLSDLTLCTMHIIILLCGLRKPQMSRSSITTG